MFINYRSRMMPDKKNIYLAAATYYVVAAA